MFVLCVLARWVVYAPRVVCAAACLRNSSRGCLRNVLRVFWCSSDYHNPLDTLED